MARHRSHKKRHHKKRGGKAKTMRSFKGRKVHRGKEGAPYVRIRGRKVYVSSLK